MSYDDWPKHRAWNPETSMWIEGYDATLRRIDDDVYRRLMVPQANWMMAAGFTAEQMEQARRQRELDRLRSEAYVNIKQLAEPHGYLT